MRKILAIVFISAAILFFQATHSASADLDHANLNSPFKIDDELNLFTINTQGKEKFQERIKNNKFMIKGVIQSSSSGSLTINNKVIIIDSSVTGNVKIVGKIQVGAYAMAQGIVQNSSLYANKIVVDQRNKKEVEENDNDNDENEEDNITPTVTVTPTVTITPTETPTPTPTGTESALILNTSEKGGINKNFNMRTLLEAIHYLLTSFRSVLSSV